MPIPRGNTLGLLLLAGLFAGLCAPPVARGQSSLPSQSPVLHPSPASLRSIHVLQGKNVVEIEIQASDRLKPQSRVLTGPDRLVVDFPNTLPGHRPRNQLINRGEVKSLRVTLLQSSPPVTRIVLDLKSPPSFQIFPYGRTVMIKFSAHARVVGGDFPAIARPALVAASYVAGAEPVLASPAAKPLLEVTFRDGLLFIHANQASLSDVLLAVHQRTGAEVEVPAGGETEAVVADYGPGPAPEVLARLLNGSRFNFLISSSADDPRKLERVILSLRAGSAAIPLQPMPVIGKSEAGPPAAAIPSPESPANAAPQAPPASQPEMRPDDESPN